jgi:hypothetical protein
MHERHADETRIFAGEHTLLESSSDRTAPGSALSARYVAAKPFRVRDPSDVSSINLEPEVDVIANGRSSPVNEASIGPFESGPSYTFTKS